MKRRWAAALLLLGACSGAPLPGDLRRAQELEGAQPDQALAAYEGLLAGCRYPGARPKDDCGLIALRRAQLLEQLGRYTEAAAAYEAVRERSLDGRHISRALQRAALVRAERLQQRDLAEALCRQVVRRWPDEIAAEDALRLLVSLRRDAADLPAELDQLAAALAPHEVAGFALLYRAERAERDGRLDEAVERYDRLWRLHQRGPLRDDAAYRAALILRRQGRSAEAARRLEDLQGTYQSSILVGHYNSVLLDDGALLLGRIYLEDLRRPAQAIAALRGFLKRQPGSLYADDALWYMAQAARQKDPAALPEACGYLRELRQRFPDGNMVRRAQELQGQLRCP